MRPPARPRRVAPVRPGAGAVPAPRGADRAAPAPPRRPVAPTGQRPERAGSAAPAEPATSAEPEALAPRAAVPERAPTAADRALERFVPAPRPTVLASAERFAERARLRRRLTRRRVAWAAAGVVLAGALGWVTFASPLLALDLGEVEVAGEGTVVDPADVLAVVEPYAGTPLPALDAVGLRREILDVPGVRAAEVTRDWPHGLRISLVSREPVAAVPAADANGGVLLLDAEGVQVGRAAEAPAGLPVVVVPVGDDARPLSAVLAVLQALPPELADLVVGASAASEDTVSLELADGQRVEWGSADESALKARVVLTLRAAPAAAGAAVIDVSAPTMPITRT